MRNIVQHIEHGDDVNRAQIGAAHVAGVERDAIAVQRLQHGIAAAHFARHQLHATELQRLGRRQRRIPAPLRRHPLGGQQPRGEQPAAATQVEHPCAVGKHAVLQQRRKNRIARQLAARPVIIGNAGRAVRCGGSIEQTFFQTGVHACRRVTVFRLRAASSSSRRGSTSTITGRPAAAPAALPSCSSRMSPALRPRAILA